MTFIILSEFFTKMDSVIHLITLMFFVYALHMALFYVAFLYNFENH